MGNVTFAAAAYNLRRMRTPIRDGSVKAARIRHAPGQSLVDRTGTGERNGSQRAFLRLAFVNAERQ
jgi:hypothetical protein